MDFRAIFTTITGIVVLIIPIVWVIMKRKTMQNFLTFDKISTRYKFENILNKPTVIGAIAGGYLLIFFGGTLRGILLAIAGWLAFSESVLDMVFLVFYSTGEVIVGPQILIVIAAMGIGGFTGWIISFITNKIGQTSDS